MSGIKIITDSSADISPEQAADLGIDVVPILLHIEDKTYRANQDLTNDQFYNMLANGAENVSTSHPSPMTFEHLYRRLALEYDHIFSLHLSNRLGGTYKAAQQACAKLPASLTRIEVIDSKSASMGLGMVVLAAARLAKQEGVTPAEVQHLINAMLRHTHAVFFVDTLEYLERSGKLALASSALGSMQRIKPLLLLDDGDIVPYERTRTRAKAIEGLYTFIEDFPHVQEVTMLYATTPEDIEKLMEKVEPIFPRERVNVVQFGATITTHIGPGAMGVVVFEGLEDA